MILNIPKEDAMKGYPDRHNKALCDISFTVKQGEFVLLCGKSGCGKTTLLRLLKSSLSPFGERDGNIYFNGKLLADCDTKEQASGIGFVMQNCDNQIVTDKVWHELAFGLESLGIEQNEIRARVSEMASFFGIENWFYKNVTELSGGQKQLLNLASVMVMSPSVLILDEPTSQLDPISAGEFLKTLEKINRELGTTVILTEHRLEDAFPLADKVIVMDNGKIVADETPREFFKGKSFYTTSANRMARTVLPDAVLAEDIILACGGNVPKRERKAPEIEWKKESKKEINFFLAHNTRSKITKKTLFITLLPLFLVPFTIYAGTHFFGDRKYFFISLLIILETLIPFLMLFESRKPKAREIIVISVLCAIAVAGRTVFFMTPHFKPTVAILIISGLCFGGETGFLVGATAGFVSNFFFGQGPWTPWQMFALGIIGFLAGLLFRKDEIKDNKMFLSIFGFLMTLVIYGGILNPASIIMWQNDITWDMILSSYIAGMPLDVVHAFATAIFLWFISEPMIEKLDRIKVKYGLYDR